MLQRQLLLKQLQELQKQNYLNQQPETFMPANTSFMPHGASTAVQGYPNGIFTQPQAQDPYMANNFNQYSHLQGLSPDSALAFTKGSNDQTEKQPVQSFYGKAFTDGAFLSKQLPNGKNLFGQVCNEGLQMNISPQEFNSRRDQAGSFEQYQGKETKIDPSQGVTTLDPLEQKILFNMDGNTEIYVNKLECSDYLSSFSSIQSGSWSALMQSAVGESSSDNGPVQEEWSGLSYQNTELSMDNQHSNNADVGNQQTDWVDNNAASSLNCKLQAPLGVTNMSSGFSGFQFPSKQREETRSDSSHESVQQSPKVTAKWLNGNSQDDQPNYTIQPPLGNVFPFQGFQLSGGNAEQRNIFAKSHDQTSIPSSFGSSSEPRVQQGTPNVASVTGSFYTKNQPQKQYSSAAAVDSQSPQATSPNISNKPPPFDLFIPRDGSQSNSFLDQAGQQYSILDASSRKPPQTPPSGTGPGEIPSEPANAYVQSPPLIAQDQHDQNKFGGNSLHETTSSYHGLEPVATHFSEKNDVGSGTLMGYPHPVSFDGGENQMPPVSARDLEAFGRSLKPSNLHPDYSGPSEIKHEMGSVCDPSKSIYASRYAFRDMNVQSLKPSSLPHLQNTAEEMDRQGLSDSHTGHNVSDVAFQRTDHSPVNMQMASWFKQYGEMRNVQMLPMYDRTAQNSTHPSPLGRNLENLEMNTLMVPLDATGDNKVVVKLSTPSTLLPDIGGTDLSIIRSRKRKTATSDLLPWHTEVTESSKRVQSISVAEMEWAKAVNRCTDKVDYEVNMIKDVHPLVQSKNRLVRTTQLMQMVFTPAPAAILRGKTTLNYDSLAYFSAKLALGDACNLISWSKNDSGISCASDNMTTEESKPGEKASEKLYSTIVEAFTSRAEKLEADFLRLDKTASVLAILMECKELEKFSMINRFAKFHFKGKPKAAETSTSSASTSNFLTPTPQLYVQARRARALPEKAQCQKL